jgi:hypothetical protein
MSFGGAVDTIWETNWNFYGYILRT